MVPPCPCVTVNGHVQQPWPEVMIFKRSDPSRMRFWIILLGKPASLAEEVAEDEGKLDGKRERMVLIEH